MKSLLMFTCSLSLALTCFSDVQAQKPRQNPGLPKVDFQMGQMQKVGLGFSVPVTNLGFERSPGTSVTVAIYDLRSRQLLKVQSLSMAPLQPNQTRRLIFVPPTPGQPILVRAIVDPGNRVRETNERNNQTAAQL